MDNFELIQKIFLIGTAVITALIKIKTYYSVKTQRQDLKLDLEILDLLKKQNNINTTILENKINADLEKNYDKNLILHSGFTGLVIGLTFFIGFGWWSINIFNTYTSFNAWIILTMFFAASGLSMIFMDTSRTIKNEPFFKIGFYEKSNMIFGLVLAMISGFILFILLVKLDSFSFWEFLSGFIFLYGLFMIFKNIRRISN